MSDEISLTLGDILTIAGVIILVMGFLIYLALPKRSFLYG